MKDFITNEIFDFINVISSARRVTSSSRITLLDEPTTVVSALSREMKYFYRIHCDNPSSVRACVRASLVIASDAEIHQDAVHEVFRHTFN